ncbi:MAG: hypothetical protein KF767_18180 [Bdellovibrionaceae bacterium]|nr:hypothetical protein [Pseudobdellovibrionaceae bacterium]
MASTKTWIVLTVALLFSTLSFAQEDIDYNQWVGREPKDMPTLLKNFQQSCERFYLPQIEKKKKPYDVAEQWTRDHCKCVIRFFKAKDDPMYVQIVNMELRGALKSMPALPAELSMYLEEWEAPRAACEANPRHVSQTELDQRAEQEEARRHADQKKNKMRPLDKSKPHLPHRPQKDKSEARE